MAQNTSFESDNYLPPHVVDYWLDQIETHLEDEEWLYENESMTFKALRDAVHKEQRSWRGIRLLCGVAPVMLLGQRPVDWDKLLTRAMLDLLSVKDDQRLAEVFIWIGQSYLVNGRTRAARTAVYNAFDRATSQASEEQALLAYIVLFRSETYEHTGEFNKLQAEVALALASRLHDKLLTPLLYQALCGAYVHQGDNQSALAYGMTALGYWYDQRKPSQIVKTALMIAATYRNMGMDSHAQMSLNIAHRHVDAVKETPYWALIEYEQAVLDYRAQQYEAGLERLVKVEQVFTGEMWTRQLTMTQHMLGLLQMEMGRLNEARQYLTYTLEAWKKQHNTFEHVSVMYDLANLEARDNNPSTAYQYANAALVLCEELPALPPRASLEELLKKLLATLNATAPTEAGYKAFTE